MANLKFNLKQFDLLDEDMRDSKKALKIIIPRVLRDHLRPLRHQLSPQIPRKKGTLARSFGYSVKKKADRVEAVFGFLRGKKISKETAIAANVLQHGSHVTPKAGKYLWIPFGNNMMRSGEAIVSPRALLESGGFIQRSKSGNLLAFSKTDSGIIPLFTLSRGVIVAPRPLPIAERVEREVPVISKDIEETIAQVIEAGKAALKNF